MAQDQLKSFLEKLNNDALLREKVASASDANEVIALAKDQGFSISSEDLSSAKASAELTESELEALSGGYGDQPKIQNTVVQATVTTVPDGYLMDP